MSDPWAAYPALEPGGGDPWAKYPKAPAINEPTGELRQGPTEPVKSVLTTIDDPERGARLSTIARASLSPNPDDQVKRYAASRFPHLPIEEAVKRYGIDRDGNIYFSDPRTGQNVREVPTVGRGVGLLDKFMRAGYQAASGIGPAIPAMAAGVAGAVTGPTGGSILTSGLAAGGADFGRQLLDRALADEPLTREGLYSDKAGKPGWVPNVDYGNVVGQAAINAAGQAASVGLIKMQENNPLGVSTYDRLKARDPTAIAQSAALAQEAKDRGIDLSVGQKTGLPSIMAKERALRTLPETVDQFGEFLKKQRMEQVPAAVRSEMDRLAPARAIDEGADLFKQGADDVMRGLRQTRTAAASPYYQAAFNSGVEPDIKPVLKAISDKMQVVGENTPSGRALKAAYMAMTEEQVINAPGGKVAQRAPITDYQKLHSIKESFDDIISGAFGMNETSAAKRAGRDIMDVQSALRNTLRTAHPGYAQGATEYVKATVPITELEGTALKRVLQKDSSAAPVRYVEQIFDAAKDIPPGDVARIRRAYVGAGKLDEWNAGVRSFVSDRLGEAMRINASGEAGGVPGKLMKSVWGTENQREIMKAALGSQQMATSFEKLMDVLQAASRSLPEGSSTAANLAAQNEMMKPSKYARFVGKLTSPGTLLSAGEDVVAGLNELRGPAKRIALAEYLLSDAGMEKLKRLTLLSPTSRAARMIGGDIVFSALERAGGRGMLGIGVAEPRMPEDTSVSP